MTLNDLSAFVDQKLGPAVAIGAASEPSARTATAGAFCGP